MRASMPKFRHHRSGDSPGSPDQLYARRRHTAISEGCAPHRTGLRLEPPCPTLDPDAEIHVAYRYVFCRDDRGPEQRVLLHQPRWRRLAPGAGIGTRSAGLVRFMGYDFHATEGKPGLIEVNTSAGGAKSLRISRATRPTSRNRAQGWHQLRQPTLILISSRPAASAEPPPHATGLQ